MKLKMVYLTWRECLRILVIYFFSFKHYPNCIKYHTKDQLQYNHTKTHTYTHNVILCLYTFARGLQLLLLIFLLFYFIVVVGRYACRLGGKKVYRKESATRV